MVSKPRPAALAAITLFPGSPGYRPGPGLPLHFSRRASLGKKTPVLGELHKLKTNGPVGALMNPATRELASFARFLLLVA